jgi:hypothetical protein
VYDPATLQVSHYAMHTIIAEVIRQGSAMVLGLGPGLCVIDRLQS